MEEVETPQEQPKEPLEEVAIAEKPQKDWLKIILFSLLGLLILSGAVYGGYWFAIKSWVPPSAPGGPTPEATPSARGGLTIEEQTKDWKTYRSERFGYEIKYPPEVTLGGRPPGAPDYYDDVNLSIVGKTQPEGAHFSDGLSINVMRKENPEGLTLREWVEIEYAGDYPTVTKIEDTSIGGLLALRVLGYGVNPFDSVSLSQGKNVLIISASYVGPDKERYKGIFDLMLQTFKFTE